MLAKYNSQMEPLYELLRQVEGIRLAPEVLEPEPVDINTIRGYEFFIVGPTVLNRGFCKEENKKCLTLRIVWWREGLAITKQSE